METWESVQIAVLQKMGLIQGDTLVRNTTTNPVIAAMPPVANRGLQLLSTAGKFIAKYHDITQDGTDTGVIQRYDFKTLVSDFYDFRDAYLDDGETYKKVVVQSEGQGVMVLPSLSIGTWRVYYNAYPQTITKTTLGTMELALDPEVVALLSTYIASELMMEDEPSMAVQFRNEFEVARGELRPSDTGGAVEFVSPEPVRMGW
jgi:hypothetical protein